MRSVKVYKGKEIDNEKIAKIKDIAKARYAKEIYDTTFWSIESVEDLAYYLHDIPVENEILVLGEDWFLFFTVSASTVGFLEWVAIDNNSYKYIQTIEMINTIRRILFKYRDKLFIADMRHDTSYQFYSKLKQKGYFKEFSHTFYIDCCNGFAPEQVRDIDDNYPILVEFFLNSDKVKKHPEYLKYILHDITFYVTDKFVERCSKLTKKL